MGIVRNAGAESAYEQDFYSWTVEQAALLRTLPRTSNALDIDNIAEEIEDLGRNARRAVESLCERIIEHYLKRDYSALEAPRPHWEREIVAFQIELEKWLTASLEQHLRATFDKRYANGRKLAVADLKAELPGLSDTLPPTSPYSLDDVLGANG